LFLARSVDLQEDVERGGSGGRLSRGEVVVEGVGGFERGEGLDGEEVGDGCRGREEKSGGEGRKEGRADGPARTLHLFDWRVPMKCHWMSSGS
jgi:hypothetical protein